MNADDLDLRQLRMLVALADEGTFTDAAATLHTSQPAVSRAIARLERQVGVRLVERTTRSVALTDAGRGLAAAAEDVLARLDAAVNAARGRVNPLRLGYAWAAFGKHTTEILRSWRDQHPDRPVEIHRVDERSGGLRQGTVDVAIIRGGIDNDQWQAELLFEEGRLAAVPSGHPLAGRSAVGIADVQGTVAITPSVGTTTVELWPAAARPAQTVVVDNIDEWLAVIASAAAIGVTPASTAVLHSHPGIVYVPITGVPPVPVYLVWPRERTHPWTAQFARHVQARIAAG